MTQQSDNTFLVEYFLHPQYYLEYIPSKLLPESKRLDANFSQIKLIKMNNKITKTPILSVRFQKGRQACRQTGRGHTDRQGGGIPTDREGAYRHTGRGRQASRHTETHTNLFANTHANTHTNHTHKPYTFTHNCIFTQT